MRKRQTLIALISLTALTGMIAKAAYVNYRAVKFTGSANNRQITISQRTDVLAIYTNGVFGAMTLQPTNGTILGLPMLPGPYWITIDQVSKRFPFDVPDGTNTYELWGLVNNGLYVYSPTNPMVAVPYEVAGTNMAVTSSNGTNTVSVLTSPQFANVQVGGDLGVTNRVLIRDKGDETENYWIIESDPEDGLTFTNTAGSVPGWMKLSSGGTFTVSDHFSGTGDLLTELNASQLTVGTVPDGRFPATLPASSGANLTALNASELGSGTVPNARLSADVLLTESVDQMAFNTNGQGLTPKFGVAGDLNMNALYRFGITLQNSNRPIRIVALGDLNGANAEMPWDLNMRTAWYNLIGRQGSLDLVGASDGDMGITEANIQDESTPSFLWAFVANQPIYRLTNSSSTLTYYRRSTGTAVADTNIYADTLIVRWMNETNTTLFGGTFKIQTNIAGTGWGDYKTINCSDFSTNTVFTNLTMPLNYYGVKIVNLTKTNRVWGISLYNSTQKGVIDASLGINGGFKLADITSARTNLTWPFWKSLDPDLIMVMDTDQVETPEPISAFEFMITNACPRADVVYIGNHAQTTATEGVSTLNHLNINYQVKTNCWRFGRAFKDPDLVWGTNAYALTNLGLFPADMVHPNAIGADIMNSVLTRDLLLPSFTKIMPWCTDPLFTGTAVNLFNTGSTNWLGIGTVTRSGSRSRLTIDTTGQAGAGGQNQIDFGSTGVNAPGIWFNGNNGASDYTINQGGGYLTINAHNAIQLAIDGSASFAYYPSGGISLSHLGTDPGFGGMAMPAGGKLSMDSGSNQRAGSTTLVGGTKTVSNTSVTSKTFVYLTRKSAGGTIGDLTWTTVAATSFTINSASGSDTSTVAYLLVEVP